MQNEWWKFISFYACPVHLAISGRQTVGISQWTKVGEGSAIGASAALDVIQHFGIVADEPGQVANVSRTVDRVCNKYSK